MNPIWQNCKPFLRLMRLDKPIGSLLLLWPTLWALWIAAQGCPPASMILIFVVGVIVMRSAGCVINDIADRKFDGAVRRTQNRPLVVGSVTISGALWLFMGLCGLGLLLVLQLNSLTLALSTVGLGLAITYPFAKRITHLPQLVLGAAFAWSVPMSFAAVRGTIPCIGWLLYGVALLWPVAYDSIYALIDKEDDLKIGVKSTAILFGRWDIAIIFILQLLVVAGLLLIGCLLQFSSFFYIGVGIAFSMMGYQIWLISKRDVCSYYHAFYNSHWIGLSVLIGIILNYLTK